MELLSENLSQDRLLSHRRCLKGSTQQVAGQHHYYLYIIIIIISIFGEVRGFGVLGFWGFLRVGRPIGLK